MDEIPVVVGAAILDRGRLLAAQRGEPPELAGSWEFPGGKVDPGETDEQALVRECLEELGIEIALGARVGGDWSLPSGAILRVWTARILRGKPAPLEDHLALRWLGIDELYDVNWLRADLPIVALVAGLLDGQARPGSAQIREPTDGLA